MGINKKMVALIVLTVAMSFLGFPMGVAAKSSHVPGPLLSPTQSPMHEIFAALNPSGSCASLGLKAGGIGDVQLIHGHVIVFVQNAKPNSVFNVTIIKLGNGESDRSWVCGASSQSVGSVTTDQAGNGQLIQSFKASSGQKYVVELQDGKGNVQYSTYSIST